jgi:uncharacterized membrane protein HdeD (DUF308 family)
MIADDIRKSYHRSKKGLVFRGLFGIALGIFIFARPFASVAALALTIALWALVDGIGNIVHAFDLRGVASHWVAHLVAGIVSTGFGIAALYAYPELSLAFAVVWVAFWLLSVGVIAGYAAVLQHRAGASWGWTMVIVVPSIAAGVLALAYPGVTLTSLLALLGVYGIVGGIGMLVAAAFMQSVQRVTDRAAHRTPRAA